MYLVIGGDSVEFFVLNNINDEVYLMTLKECNFLFYHIALIFLFSLGVTHELIISLNL